MKKLIIGMTAVIAGLYANAAVCSWSVSETISSSNMNAGYVDGNQKYANLSGYTCYLIKSADWSDATKDILSSDSVVSQSAWTTDIATWSPSTTDGKYQFKQQTEGAINAKVASGNYDVLLVISDGENFFVDMTAQTVGVADSLTDPTLAKPEWNYSYSNGNLWLTAQKGTFQDVPEPTSAMLLLLGVAGLALKRKQA